MANESSWLKAVSRARICAVPVSYTTGLGHINVYEYFGPNFVFEASRHPSKGTYYLFRTILFPRRGVWDKTNAENNSFSSIVMAEAEGEGIVIGEIIARNMRLVWRQQMIRLE